MTLELFSEWTRNKRKSKVKGTELEVKVSRKVREGLGESREWVSIGGTG